MILKLSANGAINMNPCEINAIVTGISNYLFANLSKKDFIFLNICISELSKSMFSLELLRGVCKIEKIEEAVEEVIEE